MRLLLLTAASILVLSAAPAHSEESRAEITPFIGYTTGGDFTEEVSGSDLSLDETETFGLIVNVRQLDEAWYELYLSRQQTRLRADNGTLSGLTLFDMDVDYYHLGGTYGPAGGRLLPFVVGTMGATHFDPKGADLSSETRFSFSLGGGARMALGKRFGVRVDGRWFGTLVNGSGSVFCSSGTCLIHVQGDVISQFTANAGATISF